MSKQTYLSEKQSPSRHESHHNLHHMHNINNNYSPTSLNNQYGNHLIPATGPPLSHNRGSNCGESNRSEEVDDFSESDCEKDIDICCDDDNKVTSSSAETPVSVKEEFDDDCCDEERDSICSPGTDRISPGILSSPDPTSNHHDSINDEPPYKSSSNNNNNNNNNTSNSSGNQQGSHNSKSSSKKSSKTPKVKVEMKGRCNCDELLLVNCHLETKDLWDKFHELGTEMIITKTGRLVQTF